MIPLAGLSTGSAIGLAVLAIILFVGIQLTVVHLRGARLADIDFEWNPASAASRAARAEQASHYGQALLLYAQAGQGTRVLERMRSTLPNWPVRDTLLAATQELLEIGQRALDPRSGIPASVRERLASYLEQAGTVVWTMADRVAAAGTLASAPPRGIPGEEAKLERLLQAVRAARSSLADLTLAGGGSELADVEQDFRKLSEVAESLADDGTRGDGTPGR